MQLSSLLLGLSAASAAVLRRQGDPHPSFHLTDFFIGGSELSTTINYGFNVTNGTTYAICKASTTVGDLPSFVPGTACNDSAYSFHFYQINGSAGYKYELEVTNQLSTDPIEPTVNGINQTGTRTFPSSQVVEITDPTNPNGNYYELNYTTDWYLPYETVLF